MALIDTDPTAYYNSLHQGTSTDKMAADLLAQKQSAMMALAKQRADAQKLADERANSNYLNTAAQGATAGAGFGPYGALIGGGVGLATGVLSGYEQQKKEGHNGWDAFSRTMKAPFKDPEMISEASNTGQQLAGRIATQYAAKKLNENALSQPGIGSGQMDQNGVPDGFYRDASGQIVPKDYSTMQPQRGSTYT